MTKKQIENLIYNNGKVKIGNYILLNENKCGCGCNGIYVIYNIKGEYLQYEFESTNIEDTINYFIKLVKEQENE